MELKKLSNNVYYIPSSSNIGVIKNNGGLAILIDTGLDDEIAKKVLKLLARENMSVTSIINTHSHADHYGGNKEVKKGHHVEVYAPKVEDAIIKYPQLEPLYFFSGAQPLNKLKNKFLMAESCYVDHIIEEGKLCINGCELEIVSLAGHSINQIGVSYEGVLFCSDSLFSEKVLEKHKIPFFVDIDAERHTLDSLRSTNYQFYIPAHAEATNDIKKLVNINLKVIDDTERIILTSIEDKLTTEQILKQVSKSNQIEIKDIPQYCLLKTSIMAYLSSLYERGMISISFSENQLLWQTKNNF